MMWRYRLRWFLIVAGAALGIYFGLYQAEHQNHTAGYRLWVAVAALIGVGLIDLAAKLQDASRSKGRFSGTDFRDEYIHLLTDAIEAVQDVQQYNEPQVRQVQRRILKLICSVVTLFRPEAQALGVNANLMEPEEVRRHAQDDRFAAHVHFADPQRAASSYAGVLCIKAWADPPTLIAGEFALPLDADAERMLFGAPQTYARGEEVVIDRVHSEKHLNTLLQGQPAVVRRAVQAFFRAQRYQTFLSIPVQYADKVIAVLNIQADAEGVFGHGTRPAAEMKKFIDPFCTVLGILSAQSPDRLR